VCDPWGLPTLETNLIKGEGRVQKQRYQKFQNRGNGRGAAGTSNRLGEKKECVLTVVNRIDRRAAYTGKSTKNEGKCPAYGSEKKRAVASYSPS